MNQYKIMLISNTILAVALLGCSQKDAVTTKNNSSSINAAFLTATTFASTNAKAITSADLTDESSNACINDIDIFKANEVASGTDVPSEASTSGDDSYYACATGITVEVKNKSTIILSGSMNLATCMKTAIAAQPSASTMLSFDKMNLKMYMQLTCEGADLSSFAGKSLKELGKNTSHKPTACKQSSKVSWIYNTEMTMGITVNFGTTFSTETQIISADMMPDGSACEKTLQGNVWTWKNGCTSYNKTTIVKDTQNTANQGFDIVSKVVMNGITENNDDTSKYYTAGTAAISINDWTGTATFSAADTAPTWTMSKAGETDVIGSYGQTLANNLINNLIN